MRSDTHSEQRQRASQPRAHPLAGPTYLLLLLPREESSIDPPAHRWLGLQYTFALILSYLEATSSARTKNPNKPLFWPSLVGEIGASECPWAGGRQHGRPVAARYRLGRPLPPPRPPPASRTLARGDFPRISGSRDSSCPRARAAGQPTERDRAADGADAVCCAAQAARPLGTEPAQPARANRGRRAAATAHNGSSSGRHAN